MPGRRLDSDDLISLSEAAAIANMTPDHLRYLARNGLLVARKVGRDWLTTKTAVLDYIKDSEKRSRDPHKRRR
jgi:hypothetical protein